MEILLPTSALSDNDKTKGEIALCTLAAFNLGKIEDNEDLEECADILVRALDALLDYQDYMHPAAEKAKKRRTLGIGVTNFAYWLAKNGYKYTGATGANAVHELFESIQYYLLKASNNLAKEVGKCELFEDTKYSRGELPIDWYCKNVDNLHTATLKHDWEALREDIKQYGLRNSTLTAMMPAETSSAISGSTNGIEPIRALTVVKEDDKSRMRMPAPEVQKLYADYEIAWEVDNIGYLTYAAIIQKWCDQASSANTYADPAKYGGNVPEREFVKWLAFAAKHGIPTLYYHNTRDGAGESLEEAGCAGGACSI